MALKVGLAESEALVAAEAEALLIALDEAEEVEAGLPVASSMPRPFMPRSSKPRVELRTSQSVRPYS